MADLALQFGGDLSVSVTGDISVSDGMALTQERVMRRLLTNSGDYIWQLRYGAGLGQFVGVPAASGSIIGITKSQLSLESAVAVSPAPSVTVESANDGTVTLMLRYTDAPTGQSSVLSFSV
jgi:hypothetical protein